MKPKKKDRDQRIQETSDAYLFELPNEKLPAEFSKKDIVKEIE